ncbi:MAG: serine protease [Rhodothermia bacterium]|nr:serine protease [Rhodothermia bacterium]
MAALIMFAEPVPLSSRIPTTIAVAASTADRVDSDMLIRIIRPISTVTEYSDGRIEHNDGSGFVAGSRYLTVNHNLEPSENDGVVRRTSFVDGVILNPVFGDPTEDVAVFDLPPELCESECNDVALDVNVALEPGDHLFWIRKFDGELVRKEGTVIGYAWIGDPPTSSGIGECPGNLIVQIDQPFEQGTSGSPIVEANSGKIVGIIQGTLINEHGSQSGFFKPLNCLSKIGEEMRLHPGVGS